MHFKLFGVSMGITILFFNPSLKVNFKILYVTRLSISLSTIYQD